jgi:hypothetical protein
VLFACVGCQDLFLELLSAVGTRCPNKGSIVSFNAMPLHALRSGSATAADLSQSALGAADVAVLLALLAAPFAHQASAAWELGASTVASAGDFAHASVGADTVRRANFLASPNSSSSGGGGCSSSGSGSSSSSSSGGGGGSGGGSSGSSGSGHSAATGTFAFAAQPFRPLAPATFIRALTLTGNQGMGDGGARAVAAAIASHDFPVLRRLGLGGCGVGPGGFEALADALRRHGETVRKRERKRSWNE